MLFALLLLALALRLWRLDRSGYGTEYYTAGVRSMTTSWRNFFYNSFDPAGFVSVDKPPVALWIQVASVKLLGFHELSILLPQVLEGVAAVLVLYCLVRRGFGRAAGLLAALFLTITPVSVAIDRSSNTDSCLVLVLLLAAWALLRAAESGSRRFLLLSMALVGLGFNVKMLAAFVVLPMFVLVYLLGAPVPWRRRLVDVTLATIVLIAVSFSWVLAYDLTPPDHRPFVGSSKSNSMLELVIGHNGIERFVRRGRQAQAAQILPGIGQPVTIGGQSPPGVASLPGPAPPRGWMPFGVRVPVGALRLADRGLAGQVGWLFPLAMIGAVVEALRIRPTWPLAPRHLGLILWFGWALTYGIVYSYAGGIFHAYYLATMAPPLAALAGVAVVALWPCRLLLLGALLVTAVWQSYIEYGYLGWKSIESLSPSMALLMAVKEHLGEWQTWLYLSPLCGTLAAAGALIVASLFKLRSRCMPYLAPIALGVGLLTLLVTPAVWAASSALAPRNVMFPSASPSSLDRGDDSAGQRPWNGFSRPMADAKLIAFLRANHRDERYLLATLNARQAAPIIIQTGEAVMAMGGFMGSDPILTTDRIARMVEDKQVRFVMIGSAGWAGRRLDNEARQRALTDWIRENGKAVDVGLWRSAVNLRRSGAGPRGRPDSAELYDLRPTAGLVPGASR